MAGRDNPSPKNVITAAVEAGMRNLQCQFIAICVSDEGPDNRVTVQPAIRIGTKSGKQVTPKPIKIPVKWLSWGTFVIQGKLSIGDEVVVHCQDKNWGAWLESGGVVDDTQPGGHQAGYAHAEPVMSSNAKRPGPNPVELRIGRKDSLTTVELRADGSIRLAATDVTLTTGTGLGQFLTSLYNALVAWIVVPGDGGGALKTALAAFFALPPPTGGPPPP